MITKQPNRLFLLLALCLLTFLPMHAWANAYVVTDTNDSTTDTGCLRYAISEANANPGSTITFDSTVFATPQMITLSGTELKITAATAITGPTEGVAVSGNNASTVFEISSGTSASPVTLSDLIIEDGNAAEGGGILVDKSAVLALTNSTLTGNSATYGGGIFNNGTETLTNCDLAENSATSGGGGIINHGGADKLTRCSFTANVAESGGVGGGGGIFIDGGAETLINCNLAGNSTLDGSGGGINNAEGTETLTNCDLAGNSALDGYGGGINNQGVAALTSCFFTGNSARFGGGIFNEAENDAEATITNCTLAGNSATDGYGGGICNANMETLTNDILYGDTASEGGNEIYEEDSSTVSYCDIDQSGYAGTSGNIDVDPAFIQDPGAIGSGNYGDVHLQPGSPCIGVGATQAEAPTGVTPAVIIPTTDADGFTRPATPSMGAFDAPQSNLVVTSTADGDNGFLNVNVPDSTTLRECIRYANDYSNVGITFDPTVFATPQTITLDGSDLQINAPMTITGPTAGVAISGNNASTVFDVASGTTTDPVNMSGLTIENGNDSVEYFNGGGVSVDSGDALDMFRCAITDNSARTYGGGIYNNEGRLALTNCTVTGNSAGEHGGGICSFGFVALTNCAVAGNYALDGGGGVFLGTASGAGINTLTNCTFAGNNTAGYGGGIVTGEPTTLANDVFSEDTASAGSNEVNIGDATTASYCDIGESLGASGDGVTDNGGNIDADPLFVSNPGAIGSGDYGDLHLQGGSPCIGAGATQAEANALSLGVTIPTTDITGLTRPTPPSMGAYDVAAGSVGTTTTVTSSLNPSAPGQSVMFTATVSETGTTQPVNGGSVTFDVNGTQTAEPVGANGQATISTTALPAGSDSVSASYSDTGGPFADSQSAATSQSVVTLTVIGPATAAQGASVPVTVTANLSTYTGPVTISSSDSKATGLPTGPLTLTNGTATFNVTFNTLGNQTVTATDDGATPDTSITATSGEINVSQVATHFSITPSGTATVGQSTGFTVTALDAGNNTVTGYTGTATITDSDPRADPVANVSLTNGVGTGAATFFTAGSQSLTATSGSLTGSGNVSVDSVSSALPKIAITGASVTESEQQTSYIATITLTNTGLGAANDVHLVLARIGSTSASSLGTPIALGAGQSGTITLIFAPDFAGPQTFLLSGADTSASNGSGGTFTAAERVNVIPFY